MPAMNAPIPPSSPAAPHTGTPSPAPVVHADGGDTGGSYAPPRSAAANVGAIVFHALTLPLPDTTSSEPDSRLPDWIQIIPAGSFGGRDGRGPYFSDPAAIIQAFHDSAVDLPIDYDHQTLDATDKRGPVPAAGWIDEVEERDGAIWGRTVWTPRAAEHLRAREYRFISPVFRHDKQGRVFRLEGAGLTHYPNLHLQPVANSQGADMTDQTTDKPQAQEQAAPAATADKSTAHAKQEAVAPVAAQAIDPTQWVPMAQHKQTADELAALKAQVAQEKADAAVREAMSAGKVAPAMKEWATDYAKRDPEGFAAFCKATPAIVPTAAPTAPVVACNADTLTEEDRQACLMLGISEADFAAHKSQTAPKE